MPEPDHDLEDSEVMRNSWIESEEFPGETSETLMSPQILHRLSPMNSNHFEPSHADEPWSTNLSGLLLNPLNIGGDQQQSIEIKNCISIVIPSATLMELPQSKDSFVAYSLEYKCILDNYNSPSGQVHRRFKDFSWLHYTLSQKYPFCVVPPFPDKQMLEYFDRFQDTFIERRRISLERYLKKLCLHPVFQKSEELRNFLECETMPSAGRLASVHSSSSVHLEGTTKPEPGFLEKFSERFLGSFSKVRRPSEKFEKLNQELTTLSDVLKSLYSYQKNITSSYQGEIQKIDTYRIFSFPIVVDTGKYSLKLSEIYDQLSEVIDPELKENCRLISQVMSNVRFYDEEFSLLQCQNFQVILKEMIKYISNVKDLLDRRNRRQQDYEDISEYIKEITSKRDALKKNIGNAEDVPANSTSLPASFWKRKIASVMGGGMKETNQKDRMGSIDIKVQEVRYHFL